MTYDEPKECEIANVYYKATAAQSNEIAHRLYASKEWLDYASVDGMLQYGSLDGAQCSLGELRDLSQERCRRWRAYNLKAAQVVREVLEEGTGD